MEEVFDILKEFHKLVQNGWLTDKEAEQYASDKGIIESMNGCTSPQKHNIFNALKKVSIKNVKVVILGKDPYPNPKDAHGLAFSSLDEATPDSLKNIFKAIDKLYKSNLFENKKNDLTKWAESGVLLLNTGLTYQRVVNEGLDKKERDLLQAKIQKEHMKIWKPFVKNIIQKLLRIKDKKLVMMLWGNDAHDIVFGNIKDKEFKHFCHDRTSVIVPNTSIMLLQASHPSPLSVNRGGDFLEVVPKHFEECDKFLGENKIDWTNL